MDERQYFIDEFERRLRVAARSSLLSKKPCTVTVSHIAGPRACVMFVSARRRTGEILRALRKDEFALLRGLVPFDLPERETIDAYMAGATVRIEIGWPTYLSQWRIFLSAVNDKPYGNGQWVVGLDENGLTTVCQLNDKTPHFLIAGQTGSGKSVAVQNMIVQLARDPANEIVLIDGKWGESLGALDKLSIAPCAVNLDDAKAALSYVYRRMEARYSNDEHWIVNNMKHRLIIVFDEFQEYTSDKDCAQLMRKVASLGRAVSVHLVASTQHPLCDVLGDSQTRRNLPGRIALQVEDRTASKVIIGDTSPRADLLTGDGDCYVVAGGIKRRVQGTYVDERDWENQECKFKKIKQWNNVNTITVKSKSNFRQYTAQEIANAIETRLSGEGRGKFRERFDTPPGGDRSRKLLQLADGVLKIIDIETWRPDDGQENTSNETYE